MFQACAASPARLIVVECFVIHIAGVSFSDILQYSTIQLCCLTILAFQKWLASAFWMLTILSNVPCVQKFLLYISNKPFHWRSCRLCSEKEEVFSNSRLLCASLSCKTEKISTFSFSTWSLLSYASIPVLNFGNWPRPKRKERFTHFKASQAHPERCWKRIPPRCLQIVESKRDLIIATFLSCVFNNTVFLSFPLAVPCLADAITSHTQ